MSESIEILAQGSCQIGIGIANITPTSASGLPIHNLAMAGYSTSGQIASGSPESDLLAKTLFVQSDDGEQVAICFMGLLSGSLTLWENVNQRLADTIDPRRVILVGDHTHNGPGHFFGCKLYNTFAQSNDLANPYRGQQAVELTNFLANKIAESIKSAKDDLSDGRLAIVRSRIWGLATYRSLEAFDRNSGASSWNSAGNPGFPVPAGLHELQQKVDPRMTTWLGFKNSQNAPYAAFSTVACHSTCLGPPFPHYSGDWPGRAAKILEEDTDLSLTQTTTAFALPAAGDASPLPVADILKGHGNDVQGTGLMHERAAMVARHVSETVDNVLPELAVSPSPLELRIKFGFWFPQSGPNAVSPQVGRPLLAGAEDGRGPHELTVFPFFIREGDPSPLGEIPANPQSPKRPALGLIQVLFGANLIQTSPKHPISQIWFGKHVVGTVPGEITMYAGRELEDALIGQSPDVASASLMSNTNDYLGYITTTNEYRAQHYEGGHTLFGKWSRENLTLAILNIPDVSGVVPDTEPAAAANAEREKESKPLSDSDFKNLLDDLIDSPIILVNPESSEPGNLPHPFDGDTSFIAVLFLANPEELLAPMVFSLKIDGNSDHAKLERVTPLQIKHESKVLHVAYFTCDALLEVDAQQILFSMHKES